MSNERDTSRTPTPDHAEHNAFFPSPYSLSQYTSAKTDFDGADYPTPYKGGKKVLMIGTDERYILMQNGSMFSTGNHPVEMLLPMYHLDKAGFEFDVATLSGNPVKLEMWAMPGEDGAVKSIYAKYLPKLKAPQKLADLLEQAVADDSPYAAVFVPGGHGVLAGIPHSREVKRLLNAFLAKDRYIITLCHGPACLLAPAVEEKPEDYPFKDYEICVFPDALDTGANLEIGYMPGPPALAGGREPAEARGEDPQQGHHRPGPPRPQAAHRRQPAGLQQPWQAGRQDPSRSVRPLIPRRAPSVPHGRGHLPFVPASSNLNRPGAASSFRKRNGALPDAVRRKTNR